MASWQGTSQRGPDRTTTGLSRRTFIARVTGAAASFWLAGACQAAPSALRTPQPDKVFRVIFLFTALSEPGVQANIGITRQALQELGYVENRNIFYDGRSAERVPERFPALAAEVIALAPDVIICQNPQAALALKAATSTIPVLFVTPGVDPVEAGIVASLARPGGNLTGIRSPGSETAAKRLQLLKECAPNITRVAVIRDQAEPPQALAEMQQSARLLGLEVLPVNLRTADDLDGGLAAAVAARADALIHTPTANFILGGQAAVRIADFALRNRWPAHIAPAIGGLMTYNASPTDPWRRIATYVDRIFKGANPGDLPVEGPSGSAFVINLCTAAKLGLSIPPAVLAQVTEVVQCSS
jgi:putative ABC transport system substrate-binding protein